MLRKVVFIVNPASGRGIVRLEALVEQITDACDLETIHPEVVVSKNNRHATNLSEQAVARNYSAVVAVGGDGTINQVAPPLIGTNTALGIIPAGSGNGLAHCLNIPFSVAEAVRVINDWNLQKIDAVRINNRFFFNLAGVGFDAVVARKYSSNEKHGFFAYLKYITRYYPAYKPRKYILHIDNRAIECEALMICFANSNQFGYNTIISPHATPCDGLVDVCIVKKVPVIKALNQAHLLFTRRFDESEYVEIIKAKRAELYQKNTRYVNLDGEAVKMKKYLTIEVMPGVLNLLTP
ncbi:MAG TPA: diacylglycerol kinase family protein [Bacteroidales bacterium]|nr:diacylglycerol kinase family protein [Bacteroidales bacterium]